MEHIWLSTSQLTSSTSTTLWSVITKLRIRSGVLSSTRLYIIPIFVKKTWASQLLWFKCTETQYFLSWLSRRRGAMWSRSWVISETAQLLNQRLTRVKHWLLFQRNTPGTLMCRLSHLWSKQWWHSHLNQRTFLASRSMALSSLEMILWLLTLKKISHSLAGVILTRVN